MANIDNVQLPDGSSYNLVDNTSGFATQNYVNSAVDSVTKTTIGLGNVDNTSDLDKPVSTAQQTALDAKASDTPTFTEASTRANIVSGESMSTLFGKIRKWFTDLPSMFVAKSGDTMSGDLTVINKGTAQTVGASTLVLGNNIPRGTADNSLGRIDIYGYEQYRTRLYAASSTADRNIELPDKTGIIALTSDVGEWSDTTEVAITGGNAYFSRHSKLGINRVNVSSSMSSAATTLTGKIPSAYRPTANTIGAFYDNNGSIRSGLFYTNGNIAVGAGSTAGFAGEYLYY